MKSKDLKDAKTLRRAEEACGVGRKVVKWVVFRSRLIESDAKGDQRRKRYNVDKSIISAL